MKVLVAEDNPETLELLLMLLRPRCRAEYATTGREAKALYRKAKAEGEPFDLLLFDAAMPLSLGTTALREIREEGGTTPAVFLTALPKTKMDELTAGLDNFKIIAKPFDTALLLDEVRRVERSLQ